MKILLLKMLVGQSSQEKLLHCVWMLVLKGRIRNWNLLPSIPLFGCQRNWKTELRTNTVRYSFPFQEPSHDSELRPSVSSGIVPSVPRPTAPASPRRSLLRRDPSSPRRSARDPASSPCPTAAVLHPALRAAPSRAPIWPPPQAEVHRPGARRRRRRSMRRSRRRSGDAPSSSWPAMLTSSFSWRTAPPPPHGRRRSLLPPCDCRRPAFLRLPVPRRGSLPSSQWPAWVRNMRSCR